MECASGSGAGGDAVFVDAHGTADQRRVSDGGVDPARQHHDGGTRLGPIRTRGSATRQQRAVVGRQCVVALATSDLVGGADRAGRGSRQETGGAEAPGRRSRADAGRAAACERVRRLARVISSEPGPLRWPDIRGARRARRCDISG